MANQYDKYGNLNGFIKDGKKEGQYIQYYDTGLYYDTPHILDICNYVNGKKNGCQKTYYFNGQIEKMCHYIDDNQTGEFRAYYQNGNLKCYCMCLNGRITGEYKEYYENGNLRLLVNYN